MARASASSARLLTDHEEIRNWAEERGGMPACVKGTGGDSDVGMIRIDFPGYSGEGSLEPIDWDDWFQKFDERNLAFLVQDGTAYGEQSNFNKLVSRETAEQVQRRRSTRSTGGSRSETLSRSEGRTGRGRARSVRSSARRSSSSSRSQAVRRSRTRGRSSESRSRTSTERTGRTGTRAAVRGKKANAGAGRSTRRKAA